MPFPHIFTPIDVRLMRFKRLEKLSNFHRKTAWVSKSDHLMYFIIYKLSSISLKVLTSFTGNLMLIIYLPLIFVIIFRTPHLKLQIFMRYKIDQRICLSQIEIINCWDLHLLWSSSVTIDSLLTFRWEDGPKNLRLTRLLSFIFGSEPLNLLWQRSCTFPDCLTFLIYRFHFDNLI